MYMEIPNISLPVQSEGLKRWTDLCVHVLHGEHLLRKLFLQVGSRVQLLHKQRVLLHQLQTEQGLQYDQ